MKKPPSRFTWRLLGSECKVLRIEFTIELLLKLVFLFKDYFLKKTHGYDNGLPLAFWLAGISFRHNSPAFPL